MRLSCVAAQPTARAGEALVTQALVTIDAPPLGASAAVPTALAVVLDRSGSMDGPGFDLARAAMRAAMDAMRPEDHLCVVASGRHSEVLIPARPVASRTGFRALAESVSCRDTGSVSSALECAIEALQRVPPEVGPRRVLLLTDGWLGPAENVRLRRAGELAASVGVRLDVVLCGSDGDLLGFYELAGLTLGACRCVNSVEEGHRAGRRLVEELTRVAASQLELAVAPTVGCTLTPTASCRSTRLPDLARGSRAAIRLEVRCEPRAPGVYRMGRIELAYRDASTGAPGAARADLVLEFADLGGRGLEASSDPEATRQLLLGTELESLVRILSEWRPDRRSAEETACALRARAGALQTAGLTETAAIVWEAEAAASSPSRSDPRPFVIEAIARAADERWLASRGSDDEGAPGMRVLGGVGHAVDPNAL